MNFDNDIYKININGIKFKAYLEDASETFDLKEANLSYLSLQEKNNFISTRVVQKIKLSFNVFSENAEECIKNYKNYEALAESLKPTYKNLAGTYLPYYTNLYGTAQIKFAGLISTKDLVRVDVSSFTYDINKDMGYHEIKKGKIITVLPVAFRIGLEGIIPQNLSDQSRQAG